MAAGNQRFGCWNPSCPGDCRTSWPAQTPYSFPRIHLAAFSPVGSPLEHSGEPPKVAETTPPVALTRALPRKSGGGGGQTCH